jgi:hypothetical protein
MFHQSIPRTVVTTNDTLAAAHDILNRTIRGRVVVHVNG